MRQLNYKHSGVTMVEVAVVLAIIGLMVSAALPPLAIYLTNSRLREAANGVLTLALWTRSEAIKRNTTTTLQITGVNLKVSTAENGAVQVLRSSSLPGSISTSDFTASFDSFGRITPFGTQATVVLSSPNQICSEDIRCPAVLVDSGGSVSICPTGVCP